MRTKSRILLLVVVALLAAALLPGVALADEGDLAPGGANMTTQAASDHTADEAISWVQSQVGRSIDYDGRNGAQCVDLVKAYYGDYLGVGAVSGNGGDYSGNNIPDGWSRTPGGQPQKGDILVYKSTDGIGHVAIYESDNVTYHQNYNGHKYVERCTFAYNNMNYFNTSTNKFTYWGCIHPNFRGSSGPVYSGASRVSFDLGYYTIRSKVGNRVLDIDKGSAEDGANAQVWAPSGCSPQIFYLGWNEGLQGNCIQLRTSPGKYLDSANGAGKTNVQQWTGNGSEAQVWVFEDAGDGWVYIRNMHGYYLDVKDAADNNGANVQAWTFNGTDAQKWKLLPISGEVREIPKSGLYTVESKVGGRVLDINEGSLANEANAQIWERNGTAAQLFDIGWNSDLSANYLQNKASGRFVDAAGGDGTVNVWQYDGNGSHAQNWFLEPAGDGWYYVRNLFGYYLDVDGLVDANGTNVKTWTFNGTDAQKWKLVPPSLADASIASISAQPYTGKAVTPAVSVKYAGFELKKDADYTVSYDDNVNAGTAIVTVTGIGDYVGSKTAAFTVVGEPSPSAAEKQDGSSRGADDHDIDSPGSAPSKEDGASPSSEGVNPAPAPAPAKSDLVAYAGKAKEAGFTDLDPGAWYMNAGGAFPESQTLYLDYAIAKGLMSGYSGTTRFAPDDDVSRAMVATIIYRSATSKTADTTDNDVTTKFADVPSGRWYSAAVAWCAEKGIVTGFTSGPNAGRFCPDDPVTREQLATMVGRYCQKVHGMAPAGEDVSRFKDAASISAFARAGVAFCAANAIVSGIGDTGEFQPGGLATRCQMAKVIAVTARLVE